MTPETKAQRVHMLNEIIVLGLYKKVSQSIHTHGHAIIMPQYWAVTCKVLVEYTV